MRCILKPSLDLFMARLDHYVLLFEMKIITLDMPMKLGRTVKCAINWSFKEANA
jgi:hypothetical protein